MHDLPESAMRPVAKIRVDSGKWLLARQPRREQCGASDQRAADHGIDGHRFGKENIARNTAERRMTTPKQEIRLPDKAILRQTFIR
jgi:hypothetical protein